MPRAAETMPYDGRKAEPPYRTAQDDIDDAVAEAIAAERERCAKIVEGEIFKELYRTWPWWGPGNRNNDNEMVRFCDAAAAAIRNAG